MSLLKFLLLASNHESINITRSPKAIILKPTKFSEKQIKCAFSKIQKLFIVFGMSLRRVDDVKIGDGITHLAVSV